MLPVWQVKPDSYVLLKGCAWCHQKGVGGATNGVWVDRQCHTCDECWRSAYHSMHMHITWHGVACSSR
jgi:hypothetical protein